MLHAKDATGAEVVRALGDGLASRPGLAVFEQAVALELVVEAERISPAVAIAGTGRGEAAPAGGNSSSGLPGRGAR